MRKNGIKEHNDACKVFETYEEKKIDYIFVHYARQNCFEESYEKGPRVITITVMNAESEQTLTFSIKKCSEKYGCDFFDLEEKEKDKIEYDMLENFFKYVVANKNKTWLHWNMKNNNFGFYAINDRFRELGGVPYDFDENKLVNISDLLKRKYGTNFATDCVWNGKTMGKMYDIFMLNNISDSSILNGEQEIKEYILKNILAVEQSVIGKLKAFKLIVERAADNVLVTRGNILRDVYGFGISGIAQYIQDNAILALLFAIFGSIIATIICNTLGI